MQSRIPLIVKIETEHLNFDLLIYKDPAILDLSAAETMARIESRALLLQEQQPAVADEGDEQDDKKG